MLLDIPPHIETAIIATAERQGLTVNELLEQTFIDDFSLLEKEGIYSESFPTLSDDALQRLAEWLDEPPRKNPNLQALMARYGGLYVQD